MTPFEQYEIQRAIDLQNAAEATQANRNAEIRRECMERIRQHEIWEAEERRREEARQLADRQAYNWRVTNAAENFYRWRNLPMSLTGANIPVFNSDHEAICERAALQECVDRSHEWSTTDQDKGAVLVRSIIDFRNGDLRILLLNGSRRVYQALVGPWCGITGRNGQTVYPELRWCHFPSGIVCYRTVLGGLLTTQQFERYREQLEELWGGPVLIQNGAQVGASPGAVVVRPAPRLVEHNAAIPHAQAPLQLPQRIPLKTPRPE